MLTESTNASGDSSSCTDSTEPNDDDDDSNGVESSSDDELSGEMGIASPSTPTPKNTSTSSATTSTTTESSSSSAATEPQTTITAITACCDEEAHLYIRLPVTCSKNSGNLRTVDAHCAICLGEYEAGEKIVWSALLQCQHAFHDECILPWLSKGKKRCPICRHWFVPGTKIDDQKAALQEATDNSDSSTMNNGTTRARERASTASTYDEEMEDIENAVVNSTPATEPESVAPETTTRTTAAEIGYDQPNALEQVGNRSQDGGGQPPDIESGLQPSLSVHTL